MSEQSCSLLYSELAMKWTRILGHTVVLQDALMFRRKHSLERKRIHQRLSIVISSPFPFPLVARVSSF